MRNKVFKWFEFLKECEPKTIIGVITILGSNSIVANKEYKIQILNGIMEIVEIV